jgi:hypothetical protein
MTDPTGPQQLADILRTAIQQAAATFDDNPELLPVRDISDQARRDFLAANPFDCINQSTTGACTECGRQAEIALALGAGLPIDDDDTARLERELATARAALSRWCDWRDRLIMTLTREQYEAIVDRIGSDWTGHPPCPHAQAHDTVLTRAVDALLGLRDLLADKHTGGWALGVEDAATHLQTLRLTPKP